MCVLLLSVQVGESILPLFILILYSNPEQFLIQSINLFLPRHNKDRLHSVFFSITLFFYLPTNIRDDLKTVYQHMCNSISQSIGSPSLLKKIDTFKSIKGTTNALFCYLSIFFLLQL